MNHDNSSVITLAQLCAGTDLKGPLHVYVAAMKPSQDQKVFGRSPPPTKLSITNGTAVCPAHTFNCSQTVLDLLRPGNMVAIDGYKIKPKHPSYILKAPRNASPIEIDLSAATIVQLQPSEPFWISASMIVQFSHLLSTQFDYLGMVAKIGELQATKGGSLELIKVTTIDAGDMHMQVTFWAEQAREIDQSRDDYEGMFLAIEKGGLSFYQKDSEHSITIREQSAFRFIPEDDREVAVAWARLREMQQNILHPLSIQRTTPLASACNTTFPNGSLLVQQRTFLTERKDRS